MSFEYELVPKTPFPAQDHLEMRKWWERYPVWTGPDRVIFVFDDEGTRQLRLDRWRNNPGRNDYLTPYVKFFDDGNVQLSVVGDETTNKWFHDFVVWAQERWPSELRYFGQRVPPGELLEGPED